MVYMSTGQLGKTVNSGRAYDGYFNPEVDFATAAGESNYKYFDKLYALVPKANA